MIAYPVPGKRKSDELCEAFIRGAGIGGARSNAGVFYGVTAENDKAWRQCIADGRDWYYIDNSYFDAVRGQQFRVTRNRLQHSGVGASDGKRFAAIGTKIQPWRTNGRHVVVVPQSDDFMARIAGYAGNWAEHVAANLGTDRPVILRPWKSDKLALAATLEEDLQDAWALVTWSSAAAVTAVLAGVPVFSMHTQSAAWEMTGVGLFNEPVRAFPTDAERLQWASVLADNQWTVEELRSGLAWDMIHSRDGVTEGRYA